MFAISEGMPWSRRGQWRLGPFPPPCPQLAHSSEPSGSNGLLDVLEGFIKSTDNKHYYPRDCVVAAASVADNVISSHSFITHNRLVITSKGQPPPLSGGEMRFSVPNLRFQMHQTAPGERLKQEGSLKTLI